MHFIDLPTFILSDPITHTTELKREKMDHMTQLLLRLFKKRTATAQ